MKKFESLGRMLSKKQQKEIKGGYIIDDGGEGSGYGDGCIVVCGGNTYAISGCANGQNRWCIDCGYYKCDNSTLVALCSPCGQ